LKILHEIKRQNSVAGRGTTCWKVYQEKDNLTIMVKDSWQYTDRPEGDYLREATVKNVSNVARYYHHETVHIRGETDKIIGHIRKGLDFAKATSAQQLIAMELTEIDSTQSEPAQTQADQMPP